jgi:predicted TIM-barrel fold metal-dependent hydrolase
MIADLNLANTLQRFETSLVMSNLPSNACDCHVHVVGTTEKYPMVEDRHYTAGPAPVNDLLAHMGRIGLERTVIIQPSFYGTDNACLLDALQKLKGKARGIAVVADSISTSELEALHSHGVRGLRLNLESSASSNPQSIAAAINLWAEKIAPLQWHLQVFASLTAIATAALNLHHMPVPIVLDHFALIPPEAASEQALIEQVLALLREAKAFVKLSAPYRLSSGNDGAIAHLAHQLIEANPEQILWGSDWPHTQREPGKTPVEVSAYRKVSSASLELAINTWLPTSTLKEQVLVLNPARLYGF